MKTVKKILVVLLVLLIMIQFFRPEKNFATGQQVNNIAAVYPVPGDIEPILKKACNDCHSNNTRYPWYSKIQPVAWWLADHVEEGKKELNFDEFKTYSLRKQFHKMEEVAKQVHKGEMPLDSYTLVHTEAKLSEVEKTALINWAEGIKKSMEATYPKDSLVRKK